jgi:methylated-DNA-protein-cysteine methyltransferase-like protein
LTPSASSNNSEKLYTPFTQAVLNIIKAIPPGAIMTYGQVAASAGNARASRQVVRILHTLSAKEHLPWHRVINSKMQVVIADPLGKEEQILLLRAEGISVTDDGRIILPLS